VHGGKAVVDAQIEHPDVAAISAVASTPVAEYIYSESAKRAKRVQALGSAKNHLVVSPVKHCFATRKALSSKATPKNGGDSAPASHRIRQ